MPRTVIFTPIKNESHRYLQSFIEWNRRFVDDIFIWDDRSDDRTSVKLLLNMGVYFLYRRSPSTPSFLENESKFRQTGWERMVDRMHLNDGDWVLTLDSDEFWTGVPPRELAAEAADAGLDAINMSISEIFQLDPLAERVDGYWSGISGVRMARYQSGSQAFQRKVMACGTVPLYAANGRQRSYLYENGATILHYGYADRGDLMEKYKRYSKLSGHSSKHIESIIQRPELVPWIGECPEVWRGIR